MDAYILIAVLGFILFLLGIRIIRPTHRGLTERLGKYRKFGMPGFHWIIPVNEAADKYFIGNAQVLRRLEAVEKSLAENAKVTIPTGTELVKVVGELAGIVPLKTGSGRTKEGRG